MKPLSFSGQCKCDEDSFFTGVCSEDPPALFHSSPVEPSKERTGKRTIFGVEISEGNHAQSFEASHTPSLHLVSPQFHVAKSKPSISPQANASSIFGPNVLSVCGNASVITSFPSHINYRSSLERHELQNKENTGSVDGRRKHENPTGGVSWLREKEFAKVEPIKRNEDSHQMNSHSLLNNLHGFAHKSEALMDPQNLIQDSQSAMNAYGSVASYGDDGNDGKVKDLVKEAAVGTYICGLRQHIDLNLCIEEDEAPPVPSLPRAIVRIATTEIDLESPAVFESEVGLSPQQDSTVNQLNSPSRLPLDEAEGKDELARVAAEAIIAISSSDPTEHIACPPSSVLSSDCLHWFAEVVSSCKGDFEGELNDEDSIPDGMDYFEFVTMNLTETKAEEYSTKSLDSEDQKYEQTEPASSSKRPRRGQPRKGRQQKDFQRDILPSLVTLSRHEVTEDFMSFEELFKASGFSWNPSPSRRNAPKKGSGRRRLRYSAPSVTPTAVSQPPVEKPVCRELVFGERMLTGWGKRTRRLPRQRCGNDNPPPRALKC